MGIFLVVVGLCLTAAGVAVLILASGGPFPFEAIASYIALAVGVIYAILGVVHMKTKVIEKFIRNTRTPIWLYIIGLLLIFLLIYCLLGGTGVFSIVAAVISLIITGIVGGIYALWAIAERVTKRTNRVPFWFYIVVLLPVLVLAFFLGGALWR